MNLYQKNPEIKGTICVNGKLIDDDSIVFGKDFDMFANPKTFPGQTVLLVRVEFDKLSKEQQEKLKVFESELKPKPPRHMGAITTANFKNQGDGTVKLSNKPEVIAPPKKVEAAKEVVEEKKEPEKKTVEQMIQDEENAPVNIDEVFSPSEFVDDFAGITEGNVGKVMKSFKTFNDLAGASNTDLRKVGVRSNFFGRVRERAQEIIDEIASGDLDNTEE